MKARFYMCRYTSINHSKFTLKYHIIFTCKYRKKLLIKYGEIIKAILKDISLKYDFDILEMEVDKDHVHLMISSVPKLSPYTIVRTLKQESTWRVYEVFKNELKKYYWKENTFWTDGYFVSTIGEVSSATLKKHIENQG